MIAELGVQNINQDFGRLWRDHVHNKGEMTAFKRSLKNANQDQYLLDKDSIKTTTPVLNFQILSMNIKHTGPEANEIEQMNEVKLVIVIALTSKDCVEVHRVTLGFDAPTMTYKRQGSELLAEKWFDEYILDVMCS